MLERAEASNDLNHHGKHIAVVTTIQEPTYSVCSLVGCLNDFGAGLIVVGDKKGPANYPISGVEFLSLDDQLKCEFELARKLPTGHYARKNVGYLAAIGQGAASIYETDDDNAPLETWRPRKETVAAFEIQEAGWINVFSLFSDARIWPRGFPLDEISKSLRKSPETSAHENRVRAPIQQGLANNSPDVDAIWRLGFDKRCEFDSGPSVSLRPGAWCPFNSQSTWWFPVAYPLMYLPSYCSFRMTDIWRSFIAQRCLWALGLGVVFHGPEVVQQRNQHDLMRDFEDEIPGYLGNKRMIAILEGMTLSNGVDAVGTNLLTCYEGLVSGGFFEEKEVELVNCWLADLEKTGTSIHSEVLMSSIEENL